MPGCKVTTVEELTGAPELLGGRVKTLHSTLHAAILARRDHDDDMRSLAAAGIEPIDLVVCNLYPFRSVAMRRGVPEPEVIANIDIGGPAMVRAAAKNFHSVAVVTEPDRYGFLLDEIRNSKGELSLDTRRDLAAEAFAHVASYDAAIAAWFSDTEPFPERVTLDLLKVSDLTYGENPHQRAAFYREAGARRHLLSRIEQHGGKPLSFNNLTDLQAARTIASAFQVPCCAVVKHANPAGAAVGATIEDAYERALATDPQAAFGAVIAVNRPVGEALARRMLETKVDLLFAPGYDEGAREALAPRRRRACSRTASGARLARRARHAPGPRRHPDPGPRPRGRGPLGHAGRDRGPARQARVGRPPLRVADRALRALERDRAREGPRDRRDRRRADEPRRRRPDRRREGRRAGGRRRPRLGRVLPVRRRPEARLRRRRQGRAIQPGGSVRDDEVIAAANEAGTAMVFTGRRHFLH